MSGSPRLGRRAVAGYLVLVAALCAFVLPTAAGASRFKPGSDYLALGDSLAYGYQAAKFKSECPNGPSGPGCNVVASSFNTGYVDRLSFLLRLRKPSIKTTNDGCPGESTDSFIRGGRGALTGFNFVPNPGFCGDQPAPGIGAIYNKSWLHHYYGGTQLADALAFLAAHPNTNPITIDLGSNDVLIFLEQCGFGAVPNCVTPASIGNLFAHIAGNMATIVGTLRAAAPHADIRVLGFYNAYPTVLPGGNGLTKTLNATVKSAVTPFRARFADPLPVFNPASVTGGSEIRDIPRICILTNMCPGGIFNPTSPSADIHPTNAGYAVLAWILAGGRTLAPPFAPPFGR
jgi:lysophospholipase L1-like esterase